MENTLTKFRFVQAVKTKFHVTPKERSPSASLPVASASDGAVGCGAWYNQIYVSAATWATFWSPVPYHN